MPSLFGGVIFTHIVEIYHWVVSSMFSVIPDELLVNVSPEEQLTNVIPELSCRESTTPDNGSSTRDFEDDGVYTFVLCLQIVPE